MTSWYTRELGFLTGLAFNGSIWALYSKISSWHGRYHWLQNQTIFCGSCL